MDEASATALGAPLAPLLPVAVTSTSRDCSRGTCNSRLLPLLSFRDIKSCSDALFQPLFRHAASWPLTLALRSTSGQDIGDGVWLLFAALLPRTAKLQVPAPSAPARLTVRMWHDGRGSARRGAPAGVAEGARGIGLRDGGQGDERHGSQRRLGPGARGRDAAGGHAASDELDAAH
jgi:hypothetical protein